MAVGDNVASENLICIPICAQANFGPLNVSRRLDSTKPESNSICPDNFAFLK